MTFKKIFLWSWLLTLPVTVIGGQLIWSAFQRYQTFTVRYDYPREENSFTEKLAYEVNIFARSLRTSLSGRHTTSLPVINLSVERRELALLEQHLPQSGFDYVRGAMDVGGKPQKVKVKYRGDSLYHWGWDKKSLRVKTRKDEKYDGMRSFNLMAPKFDQLNNFFSYRLAAQMGLLAPRTELVRVNLNGRDRGVHILVEQLEEATLRRRNLMPGDIYRAEAVAKDSFYWSRGVNPHPVRVFEVGGAWDKISVNNHYPVEHSTPIWQFVSLLNAPLTAENLERLFGMIDVKAWGAFSAFESLATTLHIDEVHNWRIYYDPWRQKLVPIVWDPVGWAEGFRVADPTVSTVNPLVHTSLHRVLFKSADFLVAREAALDAFHDSGRDREFLKFKDGVVATMIEELSSDRLVRQSTAEYTEAINDLGRYIDRVVGDLGTRYDAESTHVAFATAGNAIRLSVGGQRPVRRIRLEFDTPVGPRPVDVTARYLMQAPDGGSRPVERRLSGSVSVSGSSLVIDKPFVQNTRIVPFEALTTKDAETLAYSPGTYELLLGGGLSSASLAGVWVDHGAGWKRISATDSITLEPFTDLAAPLTPDIPSAALEWSGVQDIRGVREISRPVNIAPGTTVVLHPGASIIFRNRVTARGTAAAPVSFVRADKDAAPWGTVALLGPRADGSTFSHSEFDGGSGYKGDLFEYSGMFSVHDVDALVVENSSFANGTIVDDMVHLVYTTAKLSDIHLENAFSDALDIDISRVEIKDSTFVHSGNDAVDMMSSSVSITNSHLDQSGDKGISVGEASYLLAVNNVLSRNLIGVEAKDSSKAFLYNSLFQQNDQAVHAYHKNWRYDEGGDAFLFKSVLMQNGKTVSAEKKSHIYVFDSYTDTPIETGKRVFAFFVDSQSRQDSALPGDLVPPGVRFTKNAEAILNSIDASVLSLRDQTIRGPF